MSELEQGILGEMHRRIVNNFLDVAVLLELEKSPLGCYDVISLINDKHDMMLSSSKTYSCLYALERDGLVKSEMNGNRRVFKLTDRGKETIGELSKEKTRILGLLLNVFEGQ